MVVLFLVLADEKQKGYVYVVASQKRSIGQVHCTEFGALVHRI